MWEFVCECGAVVIRAMSDVRSGNTTSCGCYAAELNKAANKTHGMSYTAEYKIWRGMVSRCRSPLGSGFNKYGARGIMVCAGWVGSFVDFYRDLGRRPRGRSLDRINNNGNYSCGHCEECLANGWPMNVRWATSLAQARNKRNNRIIEFRGMKLCLADMAEKCGIGYFTARSRLNHGWSVERTFNTPLLRVRNKKLHPVGPLVQAELF